MSSQLLDSSELLMGKDWNEGRVVKGSMPGRPSKGIIESRSNRVVAFVTDIQLNGLQQISQEEGRSRSDVIHRIIAQHLKSMGTTEKDENS